MKFCRFHQSWNVEIGLRELPISNSESFWGFEVKQTSNSYFDGSIDYETSRCSLSRTSRLWDPDRESEGGETPDLHDNKWPIRDPDLLKSEGREFFLEFALANHRSLLRH
ncbi:hypothetical protein H5410_047441 [Solanum commersonii]|uniref:Uncharacterized protein n=1 Tax=Solanum commersonii TaxID=4109 RepID=A0A9J5XHB3_SOLCO|nr:hypothetical protein H5410_047441 [Solanum commersonii]